MLKMISSSVFIENGKPRPPIKFKKGLNSVIGIGSNSNSIGKSTFLMIIDYCFGGEDYVNKEQDTISNIGHHAIYFEFEFEGVTYKFERETGSPNTVFRFDAAGKKIPIHLVDYRTWLASKYELDKLGLTFRQAISRFFRVYNRGTHNELRPLNATVREDDKSGILSMLKLFEMVSDLDSLLKTLDDLKENQITFKNLKKLNVGNITATKNELQQNEKIIYELKSELEDLKQDNELGALDIEIVELAEKNELIVTRKRLRKEKRNLEIQKASIHLDKELAPIMLARNIEKLKSFFPNVEFVELEKIEKFHKDIRNIISSDVRDNNNDIDDLIFIIDIELERINEKLKGMKNTPSIPNRVIRRYSALEAEIKRLLESNENHLKQEENKIKLKEQEEIVKNLTASKTNQLETHINHNMSLINSQYFPGTNSPQLAINGLNSYQFYIPGDTGTGSRYRSVITFDMTILKKTKLPAIAHDSVMIVNIDEEKRNSIFDLYANEKEKQIFIAYDINNILNKDTVNLLSENSILKLSEGGMALFGRQWNVL